MYRKGGQNDQIMTFFCSKNIDRRYFTVYNINRKKLVFCYCKKKGGSEDYESYKKCNKTSNGAERIG